MAGKPQRRHPQSYGATHHFLCGIGTVAKGGMGMKICLNYTKSTPFAHSIPIVRIAYMSIIHHLSIVFCPFAIDF